MKRIITTAIEVHIPSTPNFIMIGDDNTPVSIAKFTDEELAEIGKQWTEKLITRAKQNRKV